MYSAALPIGLPMTGGRIPSPHSAIDAYTVASVGPYALNSRRPRDHSAASAGGHDSPPTSSVFSSGSASAFNVASTDGGNSAVSIDHARHASSSPRPSN